MSERYVFRMRLNAGAHEEYQRRHDQIWPELVTLLTETGISDYSIHLDAETCLLIGILTRSKDNGMDSLPDHPIMQKWWSYMADLMETGPDYAPITVELPRLFQMP